MAKQRVSLVTGTSRGLVLDLIRSLGPISRVELADNTGLTQATMSNVVRQLLHDGLVVEIGRGESTGGKPRILLDINPVARFAIGIQLGRESITYIVANLSGAIVGRVRALGVGGSEPEGVMELIVQQIDSLLKSLGIDPSRVVGIGVVAPGPLDLDRGTILGPPNLTAWENFPVRAWLHQKTGLPVVLDNDATAAAIGEFWGGSIAESVSHATVYMGAGVGAGIVLGGTVFRGASSNTGELGQVLVESASGRRGTVEQLASPAAISQRAREVLAAGTDATFALSKEEDPFSDFNIIATAAIHGDPVAALLIAESAQDLATAVLAMANLFDLDSVVLAGPSFATAGALYARVISERLDAEFFARAKHRIRVRLSSHVADAAAVGAAALILQEELAPRSFGRSSRDVPLRAKPDHPTRGHTKSVGEHMYSSS